MQRACGEEAGTESTFGEMRYDVTLRWSITYAGDETATLCIGRLKIAT